MHRVAISTNAAVLASLLLASVWLAGCRSPSRPTTVQIRGVIQSIDLPSHTLVIVRPKQAEPLILGWHPGTIFMENRVAIRPAEVQTGLWANVDYHVLPERPVAHRVLIEAPWFQRH